MRKVLFLFIITCLLSTSYASSLKIDPSENNLSKIERLYLTCKVWGFLKYYHPKVGTGAYDWDDKLLKVLENTQNITTYTQLNNYMYKWIYAFGPRKPCPTCNQRNGKNSFSNNLDFSWLESSIFSNELKTTFQDIRSNRFQGDHFYIERGKAGQFIPKSESSYYDLDLSNEHQRLLPLFRYWNYIEYFFPYKYQTEQRWDEVLKEMIPIFLNVKTKLDFHLAMLELIVKVDDSNAGLVTKTLDQMPYYNYLPARFEMIEDKAIIVEIIDTEKAYQNNLQIGDVLTSVNGQSIRSVHNTNSRYIWGSNNAVKERSLYHTLFMGIRDRANITIDRAGTIQSTQLPLYKYSEISYQRSKPKDKWTILQDSIGHIDLAKLESTDANQAMAELKDTKVLIFDARNSSRVSYRVLANYLKPSPSIFALFTKPDLSYPGNFIWDGQCKCGEENEDYFKGKVILLVDENTQGITELTCMCLQTAPDITTIGSQTAGTLGNTSSFSILQNLNTQFTSTGVFYPDKSEIQRTGVKLDIEVTPTIEGTRAGEDEVLNQAIQIAEAELERLRELAMLEREAKLDSIRQDSLRTMELKTDSLAIKPMAGDSIAAIDEGY